MKPNLRLFTIRVDNLGMMVEFYNKILDTEPNEVEEERLVEYKFDGSILGLYNPDADQVDTEEIKRGNNCVPGFKLGSDFESEKQRIEQIVDLQYEANENEHKWFVFEDPEGNKIEMYRGSI